MLACCRLPGSLAGKAPKAEEAATVAAAGGLHSYMQRSGPIITDSGGFQVFSLARATSEDGPELKRRASANLQSLP